MAIPAVQRTVLLGALNDLQYELVPVPKIRDVAKPLPSGSRITITSSPKMGIDRTIAATEMLAGDGYIVIPHLAAREIADARHLSVIIDRLVNVGVDSVLVLAGDAPSPAGPYESALDLLHALEMLGRPFSRIGVAAYPEGHPFIADEDLRRSLMQKSEYATYIVTQMCFSPAAIREWLETTRALGIRHPVYIGIPGKVSQKRLLAVASKVGVGASLRFLKGNVRNVFHLLTSFEYDPEELVRNLEPCLLQPDGATGFHVFTFNAIASTALWRQDLVFRLHGAQH